MNVLVTGGAGFIGSHVAEAYLRRGDRVVVLDDLRRGRRDQVPAGAELVVADIASPEAAELLRRGHFDIWNHHAAQVNVRHSVADPRDDARTNIDGLLNLLQAAVDAGVRRVLFASSGGAIYGEAEQRPTPETARKVPESPYGVSKLAGEHYLFAYHRLYGLDYVALRYSNVYGPRQDPEGEAGVIAIFGDRLCRGLPLEVFGDGEQTRDYIYVADVVAANLVLTEAALPPAAAVDDRAFNVGTGRETTVNQLAAWARRRVPDAHVRHSRPRPGEVRHSALDAAKLRALGWAPCVALEDGLEVTWAWLQGQRS